MVRDTWMEPKSTPREQFSERDSRNRVLCTLSGCLPPLGTPTGIDVASHTLLHLGIYTHITTAKSPSSVPIQKYPSRRSGISSEIGQVSQG
jgi:hypothetical protein